MEGNMSKNSIDNNGTVTVKTWQLIVGAILVMVISVASTIGVGTILNGQRSKPSAEGSSAPSASNGDRGKTQRKSTKSKRGNLVKGIGDKAAILTTDGKEIASWEVTSIDTNPTCDSGNGQSANGHFVVLTFDVVTSDASVDTNHTLPLSLGSPAIWQYYSADGSQWNGDPSGNYMQSCLTNSTELLPGSIGAGTHATGKVVFDLPSTDGVLAFSTNLDGGWEYDLSKGQSTMES